MEHFEDHGQIAVALAELRPSPGADFSRELDECAAAGFPRRQKKRFSRLNAFLVGLRPQRLALTTAATALAAIAVATVVIAGNGSGHGPVAPSSGGQLLDSIQTTGSAPHDESGVAAAGESFASSANAVSNAGAEPLHLLSGHRDVKHAAEINLLADPADVSSDSTQVFSAVHAANGIVLHSSTTAGTDAGARFEMLIPSAKLGDALANISAIDEVRYRREASDDITAPTVATGERLESSRARIDSLLTQLVRAETEAEREVIEVQLRTERRQAAVLRSQLARLHRRVHYARVQVRIESDNEKGSGGTWGIGDAFHDAGHILGIAAGVTLIGLAVLAPVALLCLLAWLTRRTWIRTQRRRALADA